MSKGDRDGMALILVSGILTLLAVAVASLAGFARAGGLAAGTRTASVRAGSAAESGLAYAAARLWENPYSVADAGGVLSRTNAADDWACRDAVPSPESPALSKNPSYARGDPWLDADADGAFAAGDSHLAASDLERNGRLDVYSGRLRGGASSFAGRFSLRIRSSSGFVCINSGELGDLTGDHDLDGILNRDDTAVGSSNPEVYQADRDGNSVPDWRDPGFRGNLHLVNLLDNLGDVLQLSIRTTRRFAPVPPSLPIIEAELLGDIQVSTLGSIVVAHRPRGGYASINDLKPFLSSRDFTTVAPYLTAIGDAIPVPQTADPLSAPNSGFEFHARIDFRRAPLPVLKALLRHTATEGVGGEPFVRLRAAEADRAAAVLFASRETIHTWKDVLAVLRSALATDPSFYDPDPFILADNNTGGWSDPVQAYLKEDLILAQMDASWQFTDPFRPRMCTLEVDRDASPIGPDLTRPRIVRKSKVMSPGVVTSPYRSPDPPGPSKGKIIGNIPSRLTTECVLGSSGAGRGFSVESSGASGTGGRQDACMDLTIAGSFGLNGQQDFEPLLGDGLNPAIWRYPGGDLSVDSGTIARKGIQSFPRFPFDGPSGMKNYPVGSLADPQQYVYPRAGQGGIQLSTRQWPLNDAGGDTMGLLWLLNPDVTFAIPYNEDDPFKELVPGCYDTGSYVDNILDPVARLGRTGPTCSGVDFFGNGVEFAPQGRRGKGDMTSGPNGVRCAWDDPPFSCTTLTGHDWTQEGTISFWYPAAPTSDASYHFKLFYDLLADKAADPLPPVAVPAPFLDVTVACAADQITLTPNGSGSVNYLYPASTSPASDLVSSGWRSVAITLNPSGADVEAVVWMDGVRVDPPVTIRFPTDTPADTYTLNSSRMTALFNAGPVDDIVFFRRALDPAEIRQIVLAPRYARNGNYTSPRFRFDPARFPEGAFLSRLSWDAFVPAATFGAFTFTVNGYDASDALIASSGPVSWNGSGPQSEAVRGLPKVHSFDVTVDITTNPALEIDGVRILRDTPVLEELSVSYIPGMPRWSGYGVR